MSEQHFFIAKIKMFCETKFDIVILGKAHVKNKTLGNMVFKCFLDPLSREIVDYIGDNYAQTRGAANLNLETLDDCQDSKVIKEMLAIKEDKLRYSQIHLVKVYGVGLRIHVAASLDSSEKIALSIAKQQIETMATYLNFKKKFTSGFGMNSFWIILNFDEKTDKLSQENCCLIDLLVRLFTVRVFDSTVFMIENDNESTVVLEIVQKHIAQKACCKIEDIAVIGVKTLDKSKVAETVLGSDTSVASMLKIFDVVTRQTYQDPNPFEPDGLDFHDAVSAVETIRKKHQLRDSSWCTVINHIYTMIPN